MKIEMSIEVADRILAELVKARIKGRFYAIPYFNGRERGWTVIDLLLPPDREGVTFSENRTSDHIVIYPGTNVGGYGGGTPCQPVTDAIHEARMLLQPGEYKKAAKIIVAYFREQRKALDTQK